MAEIEYKGIKLGGSKLLLLVPLLGTLGSGLFFGFEFYKDYMIMRSKIEKYVKPDLSGIDKKLAVLHKEMIGLKKSSDEARDYSRDIKNDLKQDIVRIERLIDATEKRTKNVQDSVRSMIDKENDRNSTLRDRINSRMDSLDDSLQNKMKTLTEKVELNIKNALENPLSKMRKK